jgi:hypothetical protein
MDIPELSNMASVPTLFFKEENSKSKIVNVKSQAK